MPAVPSNVKASLSSHVELRWNTSAYVCVYACAHACISIYLCVYILRANVNVTVNFRVPSKKEA